MPRKIECVRFNSVSNWVSAAHREWLPEITLSVRF